MLKFLMSRSSAYRFAVFLWRPFPVAIKTGKCFALSFGKGKERYKLLWGCGSIDVALYSKRREFSHISVIDSNSFDCSPVQSCSITSFRPNWYSFIMWKAKKINAFRDWFWYIKPQPCAKLIYRFTTIDIVLSSKKQREWLILLIDSVPLNYSPRARHPPLLQIRRDHTLPQPQHKKTNGKQMLAVCLCRRYLSSRAVSSQVLSAQMSLTTVFGMGTGGPSP